MKQPQGSQEEGAGTWYSLIKISLAKILLSLAVRAAS
jgi:hypothetical protein